MFRQQEAGSQPPAEAGAAIVALAARQQVPGFALAFYAALSGAAGGTPAPQLLALVADDALLLAPRLTPLGWRGFLIAEDTADGQVRRFSSTADGESYWLEVPPPAPGSGGAVWAAAETSLPIRQSPDTPG